MSEQNLKSSRDSWAEASISDSMRETRSAGDYDGGVRAPPTFPSLPTGFGRYEVVRKLGEGGMGEVYLARDGQLNREVALKIPKFAGAKVGKLMERFDREAQAAATLSHPNICPVYDAGEIDGTRYMAMGYVQGRPLSDFIRAQRMPTERSASLTVRKIALAVQEAHAKGFVHRDLKPANIMIDHRNEPIVMDFGLAFHSQETIDSRLTQDGAILGSPAYMSPEQLEGRPEDIGPACDIYALGVLLFELLTGRLPYKGTGTIASIIGEVFGKETADPRLHRPDLSPRLAAICQRAIAKRPADRFDSMSDFAASLTAYLKAEPDDSFAEPSPSSTGSSKDKASDSAELIRAREQYELAQSLCRSGQFIAAATVLERMSQLGEPDTADYSRWATSELARVRDRAERDRIKEEELWADETIWNEQLQPVPLSGQRRRSVLASLGDENRWLPYLIAASLGALLFMLGLFAVGTLGRLLGGEGSASDRSRPAIETPADNARP